MDITKLKSLVYDKSKELSQLQEEIAQLNTQIEQAEKASPAPIETSPKS